LGAIVGTLGQHGGVPGDAAAPLDPLLVSAAERVVERVVGRPGFAGVSWRRIGDSPAWLVVAMVDPPEGEAERLAEATDFPVDQLSVRAARHPFGRLLHFSGVAQKVLDQLWSGDSSYRWMWVSPADLAVVVASDRPDWTALTHVLAAVPCDAIFVLTGPEQGARRIRDDAIVLHPAIDRFPVDPVDLSGRDWLARREFTVRLIEEFDEPYVEVLVDGVPLAEVLQPLESVWGGVPLRVVAPPSKHWLGEPHPDWSGERGAAVIDGSCGAWECCGVTARIKLLETEVMWAIDHSTHALHGMWEWRRESWLRFDRTQYESAIANLPR
jgi:hypothetical protein